MKNLGNNFGPNKRFIKKSIVPADKLENNSVPLTDPDRSSKLFFLV